MQVDLTIKNYRCFADADPLKIQLRKGFTGLVGINNSGKSSLLRFFFEFRNLFDLLSRGDDHFALIFAGQDTPFSPSNNILDYQELFSNTNSRDIEMEFLFIPDPQETSQPRFKIVIIVSRSINKFRMRFFMDDRPLHQSIQFNPRGKNLVSGVTQPIDISIILNFFSALKDTLYIGPFRNAVNQGTNANYFDIAIGQAFISNWRSSKTGRIKSSHQAILRLTEDIKRIFNFRQLEINASDDNQTMQLFIDGKSYFLPELGSGISHFILVLASAAFLKPSYILIDEPEMGLHPSLQLDFLTTLGSYATEGVIFSTHTLGLARGSAERILSLRKKEDGTSQLRQLERTPRLSEFLGELGFSGYHELGFDKILLVEGATDVKTFQQFLRKYGLDHKVVLMGGWPRIERAREGAWVPHVSGCETWGIAPLSLLQRHLTKSTDISAVPLPE